MGNLLLFSFFSKGVTSSNDGQVKRIYASIIICIEMDFCRDLERIVEHISLCWHLVIMGGEGVRLIGGTHLTHTTSLLLLLGEIEI